MLVILFAKSVHIETKKSLNAFVIAVLSGMILSLQHVVKIMFL